MPQKTELIKKLKELSVVQLGKFTFTAGGKGDFYIDIKKALGDAEALNMMADMLRDKMPKDTICVASGGYGGIPLAAAIAVKYNLKLALMREKQKNYGTEKLIDGYQPKKGDKVAIIDDVFMTGGSVAQMYKNLQTTNAEISGIYVVADRSKNVAPPASLSTLLKAEDLL